MRTSTDVRLALAAAALLAGGGCAGSAATTAADPAAADAVVSVLIYSGRENPSFHLDQAGLARVAELLRAAAPNPLFQGASVTPSILGYQGLRIVNHGRLGGLPFLIVVRGEDVEVRDRDATFLTDRGATVEAFLLEQAIAQGAITPEIRERIKR